MEWQPIETAPTHVDVLLYSQPAPSSYAPNQAMPAWLEAAIGQRTLQFDKKGKIVAIAFRFRVGNQLVKRATAAPTHWMPLPAPPLTASDNTRTS